MLLFVLYWGRHRLTQDSPQCRFRLLVSPRVLVAVEVCLRAVVAAEVPHRIALGVTEMLNREILNALTFAD